MKAKPVTDKKVKRGWADAEEKRWIEYKNEFARLEVEQEQRAFEAKIEYEMSLNRQEVKYAKENYRKS